MSHFVLIEDEGCIIGRFYNPFFVKVILVLVQSNAQEESLFSREKT